MAEIWEYDLLDQRQSGIRQVNSHELHLPPQSKKRASRTMEWRQAAFDPNLLFLEFRYESAKNDKWPSSIGNLSITDRVSRVIHMFQGELIIPFQKPL